MRTVCCYLYLVKLFVSYAYLTDSYAIGLYVAAQPVHNPNITASDNISQAFILC